MGVPDQDINSRAVLRRPTILLSIGVACRPDRTALRAAFAETRESGVGQKRCLRRVVSMVVPTTGPLDTDWLVWVGLPEIDKADQFSSPPKTWPRFNSVSPRVCKPRLSISAVRRWDSGCRAP
jgi:hypothetical protein